MSRVIPSQTLFPLQGRTKTGLAIAGIIALGSLAIILIAASILGNGSLNAGFISLGNHINNHGAYLIGAALTATLVIAAVYIFCKQSKKTQPSTGAPQSPPAPSLPSSIASPPSPPQASVATSFTSGASQPSPTPSLPSSIASPLSPPQATAATSSTSGEPQLPPPPSLPSSLAPPPSPPQAKAATSFTSGAPQPLPTSSLPASLAPPPSPPQAKAATSFERQFNDMVERFRKKQLFSYSGHAQIARREEMTSREDRSIISSLWQQNDQGEDLMALLIPIRSQYSLDEISLIQCLLLSSLGSRGPEHSGSIICAIAQALPVSLDQVHFDFIYTLFSQGIKSSWSDHPIHSPTLIQALRRHPEVYQRLLVIEGGEPNGKFLSLRSSVLGSGAPQPLPAPSLPSSTAPSPSPPLAKTATSSTSRAPPPPPAPSLPSLSAPPPSPPQAKVKTPSDFERQFNDMVERFRKKQLFSFSGHISIAQGEELTSREDRSIISSLWQQNDQGEDLMALLIPIRSQYSPDEISLIKCLLLTSLGSRGPEHSGSIICAIAKALPVSLDPVHFDFIRTLFSEGINRGWSHLSIHSQTLIEALRRHPEVYQSLLTGGDPTGTFLPLRSSVLGSGAPQPPPTSSPPLSTAPPPSPPQVKAATSFERQFNDMVERFRKKQLFSPEGHERVARGLDVNTAEDRNIIKPFLQQNDRGEYLMSHLIPIQSQYSPDEISLIKCLLFFSLGSRGPQHSGSIICAIAQALPIPLNKVHSDFIYSLFHDGIDYDWSRNSNHSPILIEALRRHPEVYQRLLAAESGDHRTFLPLRSSVLGL